MAIAQPPIALALQGGGAHGAFTWGVLDRLLQEPTLEYEAISATSSGAVNAVALVDGWIDGGREGARARLDQLWQRIGRHGALSAWTAAPFLELTRHFSPAQLNPLNVNPLAELLADLIDFDRLRAGAPIRLYLAATRVRDGALVLFGPDRIELPAVLASACLPQLFRAVEIDGEAFWDGGFAGNPALSPLVHEVSARDLLCVLLQPVQLDVMPVGARQIAARVQELSFLTTFLRELEALATTQRLIKGKLALTRLGRRLQSLRLHVLQPARPLSRPGARAGLDARPRQLRALRDLGRDRAEAWLAQHRDDLGRRPSYPLSD